MLFLMDKETGRIRHHVAIDFQVSIHIIEHCTRMFARKLITGKRFA